MGIEALTLQSVFPEIAAEYVESGCGIWYEVCREAKIVI